MPVSERRDEQNVIAVTMTPAAAEVALKALALAAAALVKGRDPDHPRNEQDVRAWEAEQWINWIGGRITAAQRKAEQDAG